jgi:ubiquinone/menaquinone biosynthesis C-methylase UbiE
MTSHEELKARAAAAYNAAADWYDAPQNTFWDRFGTRTVERLGLQPGMRVLDCCCGSGASAIPAAEAVGPTGSVLAIDIADDLLARLHAKAEARGLRHLEARTGDLLHLDVPEAAFDAVVCVFGIFFVADMAGGLRELWSRVTPGGQMAITTWGPRLFEPANTTFWEAVRRERPDLFKQFTPWDALTEPEALRQLLTSAGVPDADIKAEPGRHRLDTPSAWWALLMGSGYRGTLDQLTPDARERVKLHNLRYLVEEHVSHVEANVLYAVSRKAAGGG